MTEIEARNWREAKPKWAIDAAKAEMAHWQLTAALAWPREAKPEPAPFRWVDYDRLMGGPVAGTYWCINHGVTRVDIREKTPDDKTWKPWLFRVGRRDWTTNVQRGFLYLTERDAVLAMLWDECEAAAKTLVKITEQLATASEGNT